jgi:hypothetical protein
MVKFNDLWDKHPGWNATPCNFENQCAVRMGVALSNSKVDLKTFEGARCWFDHKPKHILRAQELANWISKQSELFGEKTEYKRKDFPNMSYSDFSGKKGIVFIQDGWGATDHIDLWNGYEMKAGEAAYFSKGVAIWFWRL